MKTIQIQNGKATYEGLEIENFAECQPLDGIHFKDEQYPLRWKYKDGNYPLPEGWDVVKYKNLNEFGLFITARLIRKEQQYEFFKEGKWHDAMDKGEAEQYKQFRVKEQNSAHGYTINRDENNIELYKDGKMIESKGLASSLDAKCKSENSVHGYKLSAVTDWSEPELIPCAHCGVPLESHGTCCGWENASIKINSQGLIIDSSHPGFGKYLNLWKQNYYTERAVELSDKTQQIGPLNDKKLSLDLRSAPTKDELRKEFNELMLICRTNNGRPDWMLIQDVFDWFYSKLSEKVEQITRLKEEIKQLKSGPNKHTVEQKAKTDNLI